MISCAKSILLAFRVIAVHAATNPTPYIDILSPTAVAPNGGRDVLLNIYGAGFAPGALVKFNGTTLVPAAISLSKLSVTIPQASLVKAGTATVAVVNANARSGKSNAVYLPVMTKASSATFASKSKLPLDSGQVRALVTGDFNNDGIPDCVFAVGYNGGPNGQVRLGDGKGNFSNGHPLPLLKADDNPLEILSFVSIDLDGDGDGNGNLDLIARVDGYPYNLLDGFAVLLGDGEGGFTIKQITESISVWRDYNPPTVADMNGDGIPDLIAIENESGNSASLAVYPGTGDGAFSTTAIQEPIGIYGSGIDAIGDFNGDGFLDVLLERADPIAGDVLWLYKGSGDGHFVGTGTGFQPYVQSLITGDFNNDGKLDFVFRECCNNNDTYIALNDGTGNFARHSLNLSSYFYAAGDFDGDGNLDVMSQDGIYLNDGNLNFTLASPLPNSLPYPQPLVSLQAADFDGDGRLDLLVGTRDTGFAVLLQVPEIPAPRFATSVDFGSHGMGIWVNEQVPVTNTESATLYLTNVRVSAFGAGTPDDFTAKLGSCSAPVEPGQTCSLHLTHRASLAGQGNARIFFKGNFAPSDSEPITVSGTGLVYTNFKDVAVHTKLVFKMPITNIGHLGFVSFGSLTIETAPGTPKADFQVDSGNCWFGSLDPGHTCELRIVFQPSRKGIEFARLTLHPSGGGTLGYTTLYLYGTGVAPK